MLAPGLRSQDNLRNQMRGEGRAPEPGMSLLNLQAKFPNSTCHMFRPSPHTCSKESPSRVCLQARPGRGTHVGSRRIRTFSALLPPEAIGPQFFFLYLVSQILREALYSHPGTRIREHLHLLTET